VKTRVLITAGRRDPICPPALTQGLADWFAAQGGAVSTHWHPGGHGVESSEIVAARDFLATERLARAGQPR
jgi:phospholipase/carboxylesterase